MADILPPFDDRDGMIWFDGTFGPWRDAKLHPLSHGLHYASSLFEGERAYSSRIFKLQEHTDRLFESATQLDMTIPFTPTEINDACNELKKNPKNDIINQFDEYYNYAIHRAVTGPSFEKSFLEVKGDSDLQAKFYVSASGSSGTLAAGDYLKDHLNSKIAVVEATECPTLLNNGYGEHNIQGIGDKHVPLIHNVMNTDFVVGISEKATNNLNMVFNTEIGQKYLINKKGFEKNFINRLPEFGFSTIANILASIKIAKYMNLGSNDAIITVATDGADLYLSELDRTKEEFIGIYDEFSCAEIIGQYLKGATTDNTLELNQREKERIFNLGYYTWVEQQGIEFDDFEMRRDQQVWKHLQKLAPIWDELIEEFNNQTGVLANR